MTLYAIVENFNNAQRFENSEHYEDQIIGLYESEVDAINHINDSIPEIFEEDGTYRDAHFYKVKDIKLLDYGSLLSRRVKRIDTNNPSETLSGKFVFSPTGLSVDAYLLYSC